MTSSHPTPAPCQWFAWLAAALDRRSAPRLALLFLGAVLARGRRTVTSWIRAANLGGQYQSCYLAVAAAGKRADHIAWRLFVEVVRPLLAGATRLTLALDDTPTKRFGPHVQGAGVHHNPTPGPAGSSFVYGHVFVVLGLLVHHAGRVEWLRCASRWRPGPLTWVVRRQRTGSNERHTMSLRPRITIATLLSSVATSAVLMWANLRVDGIALAFNVDAHEDAPTGLGPVGRYFFFRGWPLSPCRFSLIQSMRFRADWILVYSILVVDLVAAGFVLLGVALLCSWLLQALQKNYWGKNFLSVPPSRPIA